MIITQKLKKDLKGQGLETKRWQVLTPARVNMKQRLIMTDEFSKPVQHPLDRQRRTDLVLKSRSGELGDDE